MFTAESEVFAPLSTKTRGPATLARYFIYDGEGYLLSPFGFEEESFREKLDTLQTASDAFDHKTPVLSHERLSGSPHAGGFDAPVIAQRLHQVFPAAKVLIVIRRQPELILSNYFQYLSMGGTHSLTTYLNTPYDGKRPHFSPHHFNFLPLVQHYHKLFGQGSVLVLPYELLKTGPQEFLAELGRFVGSGIPLPESQAARKHNATQNEYTLYHLRALHRFRLSSSLNDYSTEAGPLNRGWSNALLHGVAAVVPQNWNTQLKDQLTKKTEDWCQGRYTDANQQLAELLKIDLKRYGYF